MKGFQLTLFTQEHRMHNDMPLARWILDLAREIGVRGATQTTAQAGFGHDGRVHSTSYFDLEDRPQQVTMALTQDELDTVLKRLGEEKLSIFYTKIEIEFGFTSDP